MPKRLLRFIGPPAKPLVRRFWQISRGMTLGVRCAAFNDSQGICLIRHTYVAGWSLPGGGVEPGETIYQAAERELREETELILGQPAELFGFYANAKAGGRDHVALLICRDWYQRQPKQPDLEIAEAAFFPLDALPETTTASTRARLSEIFDNVAFSHWW